MCNNTTQPLPVRSHQIGTPKPLLRSHNRALHRGMNIKRFLQQTLYINTTLLLLQSKRGVGHNQGAQKAAGAGLHLARTPHLQVVLGPTYFYHHHSYPIIFCSSYFTTRMCDLEPSNVYSESLRQAQVPQSTWRSKKFAPPPT